MLFENTALVPKLEPSGRVLAQSFAPTRKRPWPAIMMGALVLLTALVDPMVPIERQLRAHELRASITGP